MDIHAGGTRGVTAAPNNLRAVAAHVLFRVVDRAAWAAPTLDAEISRAGLTSRDAALATEIVYGTLRVLPQLDELLRPFLTAPARLDPFVRATLRSGVYQIHHLSRVPAFAIVDESVSLVRERRGPKLAGLTNAVLRKIAERAPSNPAPPDRLAIPQWLAEKLSASLGDTRASSFVEARSLPAPIGLRVRYDDPDSLLVELRSALSGRGTVRRGRLADAALLVRGVGDPRRLPGYDTGSFVVQEQGAQAVAAMLGAEPGETVVDACSGRGGKTLYLRERVGTAGQVIAVDLHEAKLERLRAEFTRLGVDGDGVDLRPIDLSVGLGGLTEEAFDRVMVDAPCTGIGTIHRRPELLLRLRPEDLVRLARLQSAILAQCARLVRPGGTLAYAVCSPTLEEGPGVVSQFASSHRSFSAQPLPGADADGIRRIGPWDDECDAYQVIVWRRDV